MSTGKFPRVANDSFITLLDIYYSETRRRVKLPFDTEYEKWDKMLKEYLLGMKKILADGVIPQKARGVKCSGCSLYDVCFPKTVHYNVRDEIMSGIKGEMS